METSLITTVQYKGLLMLFTQKQLRRKQKDVSSDTSTFFNLIYPIANFSKIQQRLEILMILYTFCILFTNIGGIL